MLLHFWVVIASRRHHRLGSAARLLGFVDVTVRQLNSSIMVAWRAVQRSEVQRGNHWTGGLCIVLPADTV